MTAPSNQPFDPDVLPAKDVLVPSRFQGIQQHFGMAAKMIVASSIHESIPQPLRANDRPGHIPSIRQPEVIGIVVGAAVGNLVVAGFPGKEHLAKFLDANVPLKDSLVTTWRSYWLLWLRTDFVGPSVQTPELLWITQGVVPIAWLDRPDNVGQVHQPGTPKQVDYVALVWPESVESVLRFQLVLSAYGPPFLHGKRKVSLRLGFWAAWAIDRLRLIYDPRISSFARVVGASKKLELLSIDNVVELALNFLQRSAALEPKRFPFNEINLRRVRELVSLMRTMAAVTRVSEPQGLKDFLLTTVQKQPGATVTVEELWNRYAVFCQARVNVIPYMRCEFQRVSPGRLRELFGKTRVNSVVRDGKARRGYNDIGLLADLNELTRQDPEADTDAGTGAPVKDTTKADQVRDGKDARDAPNGHSIPGAVTSDVAGRRPTTSKNLGKP